ncbi:hypothetical protein BIU88_09860 [Chlorobaculum limnaeum]|uniref:Shedu protein SduA C-terminal domain-containing protein n=1 Tax=Chlorobaculum limnaeum TaxID=274537 RepID=A0A1D8D555_CHLLM|nr:hypothetical protein BIU88_09860 [Chlorobaculum limnaeum]
MNLRKEIDMDDIFSDSLPLTDELSLNNMQELTSQIKIDSDEEKVLCYYIDAKTRKEHLLAEINIQTNISIIYPTNTIEGSTYYLEPKYEVREFVFEGYKVKVDKTDSYEDAMYGLPNGFTKTLKFGLGLEKKYKVIIVTLFEYFKECERIILSKTRETGIENTEIIINDTDFDKIRRGIDRNQDLFQKEAMLAKESFVYDSILNYTNPEKYPELKRKPQKDVIYKVLRNTDFKNLSKQDKQSLSELKDNTDLSYLSILTTEFEQKLSQNHIESSYQLFFEENPLLLTMLAGSPYVQFKNQAYVGGKSFDNSNGQYPDFLQKHKITNNTFIVEIKTPQTLLLEKTPYRKTGVYSASKDLSGSISQILTQKYQLETDIASLMKNAEDREVEAYNVQGLVIIGKLSSLEEKEMKRSFELFRNNQKNLRIVTYDECLEQLKSFVDLLEKSKAIEKNEKFDDEQ